MNPYDRVLLTGGGGMLATAFRALLTARGVECHAPTRAEFDITHNASASKVFSEFRPTLVLNCAAFTAVDLAEQKPAEADDVNGMGPSLLANECLRHGGMLVHFSTDYVFDGTIRRPLRPDDPVGPASAYGRSKLLGETRIRERNPPGWLIVRTAWLYGPNGPNFVKTMVNAARAGKPLRVVADQVGCPTYTFDLAAATLELIDRGASGVHQVANAGQTTWFEFARAIFDEWGLAPDLRPITSGDWKAQKPDSAIRPAYSLFDLAPAEQFLGRPMRPWRDALRDYRAHVEKHGF